MQIFSQQILKLGQDGSFKNFDKDFICAVSSFLPKAKTALEAEGFSLLHAMQLAWHRCYRWMIFERDSTMLLDLIYGRRRDITMDNLICLFAGVHFLHIDRRYNVIVDKLTHIKHSQYNSYCIYNFPPYYIFNR